MQSANSHPRPQLSRTRWIDLRGPWLFAYDDEDLGLDQGWFDRADVFDRTIQVPFPPESAASGIGLTDPHDVLWYRRSFTVEPEDRTGRLLLWFGAVDYAAEVWVNGQSVAKHEGGHTTFHADITQVLLPGEQTIVVRAEDRAEDRSQPRGKQYWGKPPSEVWYHRTSGIWQTVWLEPVPSTFISEVNWASNFDDDEVRFDVEVKHRPPGLVKLRVELQSQDELLADDVFTVLGDKVERAVSVPSRAPTVGGSSNIIWSPEQPNLIEARLTLLAGDTVIDTVNSYLGHRSVDVEDGRFLLNGTPYYLRMVLSQGYWPETFLAAPHDDALKREVEAIKALGFNGVRVHQKIEDPRFLYWCDRLGLVVWVEMPSAYEFSSIAVGRLTREWIDVIARDRNHPCVLAWVPFNESWGVLDLPRSDEQRAYVQAITGLTRALDGTRPVLSNDGWEHVDGDIVGIHDYTMSGTQIRARYGSIDSIRETMEDCQPNLHQLILPEFVNREQPVVLSEFGGVALRPDAAPAHGYGSVRDADGLLAKYEELVGAVLASSALAGFCYTQLTDVEHEVNGLLTAERSPKLDIEAVRSITLRPSESVPGEAMLAEIAPLAQPPDDATPRE